MQPCFGCGDTPQKIKDNEAISQAKQKAISEGTAFAIYRDEYGNLGYTRASDSAGYPVFMFVTANLS